MVKEKIQPHIYEASFSSVLNMIQTEGRKVNRNTESSGVHSVKSIWGVQQVAASLTLCCFLLWFTSDPSFRESQGYNWLLLWGKCITFDSLLWSTMDEDSGNTEVCYVLFNHLISTLCTDTMELAKIPQPHVQVDSQVLHQFSFSHNKFSISINVLGKLRVEILKSHNKF